MCKTCCCPQGLSRMSVSTALTGNSKPESGVSLSDTDAFTHLRDKHNCMLWFMMTDSSVRAGMTAFRALKITSFYVKQMRCFEPPQWYKKKGDPRREALFKLS